jgi:hypothetical protein
MTPEGKIKQKIKKILDNYGSRIYVYMPVPGGYGKSTLDYLGFIDGRGFAIEAKRPGKEPTTRQQIIRAEIERSGTPVFLINDDESLQDFECWLEAVYRSAGSYIPYNSMKGDKYA